MSLRSPSRQDREGELQTCLVAQSSQHSYGFELLPVPAHCARLQMVETKRRWAMWCLNGNTDIEAHEGDFRTIPDVAKRLRDADVVVSPISGHLAQG